MDIIVFMVMVCGEPDIIVVKEPEQDAVYGYYSEIIHNKDAVDYLLSLEGKAEVIQVTDTRGICT